MTLRLVDQRAFERDGQVVPPMARWLVACVFLGVLLAGCGASPPAGGREADAGDRPADGSVPDWSLPVDAHWPAPRFVAGVAFALAQPAPRPRELDPWPCDPSPRQASGNLPDPAALSGDPADVAARLGALAGDHVVRQTSVEGAAPIFETANGTVFFPGAPGPILHRVSGAMFDLEVDAEGAVREYLEALGLPPGANLTFTAWVSQDLATRELVVYRLLPEPWTPSVLALRVSQTAPEHKVPGRENQTELELWDLADYRTDLSFLSLQEIEERWRLYEDCQGAERSTPSIGPVVRVEGNAARVVVVRSRDPDPRTCDGGQDIRWTLDAVTGAFLLPGQASQAVTYSCQPTS